jgi:transcriptional regulator
MQVALEFDSLVLGESLKLYLKDMIVDESRADFIVGDHEVESRKPLFLVSHSDEATLKVPFSKDMLISCLEEFSYKHKEKNPQEAELADMIEELDKKHKAKIDRLMSDFYGKS